MKAINTDVTSLRGVKKIRLSLILERGHADVELNIPETIALIGMLNASIQDVYKEDLEYINQLKRDLNTFRP